MLFTELLMNKQLSPVIVIGFSSGCEDKVTTDQSYSYDSCLDFAGWEGRSGMSKPVSILAWNVNVCAFLV